MASYSISQRKPQSGAPYCSDPNCPYCKGLRETEEAVREKQPIPKKAS